VPAPPPAAAGPAAGEAEDTTATPEPVPAPVPAPPSVDAAALEFDTGASAAEATADGGAAAPDDDFAAALEGDSDDIGDISDDDDDNDGDVEAAAAAAADAEVAKVRTDPKNRTTAGVFASDSEDDGGAAVADDSQAFIEEEEETPQDIEYSKEISMPVRKFGSDICLLKMPNFLSIEPVPFHPETYEEVQDDEVTGKMDELGRNRVKLSVDNTLRWRYAVSDEGGYAVGDDGEYVKESNAKLVKWSDGSETLVLGDTHIAVVRKDISNEVNSLLLQHDEQNLESIGLMSSKISLKPTSTKSKFHQRLTKTAAVAVEKKLQKVVTLKGATIDPKTAKQEMDRTQSAHISASRRREEKQYAERERQARGAPISREFIEHEVDFGTNEMESEESDEEVPQARASQRRRIDDDEDDDGDDDDDDDAESSESQSASASEARKRRKIDDSDEDD